MSDPIKLGMVGGGNDAFIGAVHRIAARLDGEFVLTAGALSSTPEKAMASGKALGLAADRTYPTFLDMAKREARLKDGIEAVAIVTPNHLRYLRQAFDVNSFRCKKNGGRRQEVRRTLYSVTQLHWLPNDPSGQRNDCGWHIGKFADDSS